MIIFKDINKNVMLLTLKAGTYSIEELRKKYIFISKDDFSNLVRNLIWSRVFIYNNKDKTISYSTKFAEIITFVKETNFVENYNLINDDSFNKKSTLFRDYINKIELSEDKATLSQKAVFRDILNKCLEIKYKNNCLAEISFLNIVPIVENDK